MMWLRMAAAVAGTVAMIWLALAGLILASGLPLSTCWTVFRDALWALGAVGALVALIYGLSALWAWALGDL